MKKILSFSIFILISLNVVADDSVCKPMAALAKMSAEQRDKGMSQDTLLKGLVQEGKLDPKDPSGPFVVNTVVWVYQENIPAKIAYGKMYSKCVKAFAKKR